MVQFVTSTNYHARRGSVTCLPTVITLTHVSVHVSYIWIFEDTHHAEYSVTAANVRQKGISQAFALRRE